MNVELICIDIDECETGQHTCKGNQQCLNRGGGYICQCPRGYTVTANGECEDIDECSRYSGQVNFSKHPVLYFYFYN